MASGTNMKNASDCVVQLKLVSPGGPALANHAGCLVEDVLYVHGGINKKMSTTPLNTMYCLNLSHSSPIWQEIHEAGSPALSHHAGLVLENRYILLIGGWDGKVRSCRVFAFDTREKCWVFPTTTGFPEGAGLSSHTVSMLDDGSILVVGREGGARLQRRYGNAWRLTGSIHKGQFVYKEHDINLTVSSRSGHTMHTVGSTLAVIGGRSDNNIELHKGYRSVDPQCRLMTRLAEYARTAEPMSKEPCGRKQHVSTGGAGVILIHGGETFDGRSRDPVSDLYLVAFRPHMPCLQWFRLGHSGVGLAGHVCCVDAERVIIHGGLGARGVINCQTYMLSVT